MGHKRETRLDRRQFVQAVGAGVVLPMAGLTPRRAAALDSTPAATAVTTQSPAIRVYPPHGTVTASPQTEISFRGASSEQLGGVRVSGSRSGGHSGLMMEHQDGQGVSFVPDAPFAAGEQVTVTADIPLQASASGSFEFEVSTPRLPAAPPDEREVSSPDVQPWNFVSRPDLRPPMIDVLTDTGEAEEGLVFLAPRIEDGQSGVMIIDGTGEPVWYQAPDVDLSQSTDFKVQSYRGEPVLVWWQGAKPTGYGVGHYLVYNQAYEDIAAIQAGNGFQGGDLHEVLITPRDTALFSLYVPVEWDLSPYGGPADGIVLDGVIQEVEVETGRVLLEWHLLDHLAIDESFKDVPKSSETQFDYVHLNSIGETPDGNLIISARHCNSIIMIERLTGKVLWRLNGKRSDFAMGEGTSFAYQHDARLHGNGVLSLFDNTTDSPNSTKVSRGMILQLDTEAMTADLLQSFDHPDDEASFSQGNTQVLPEGNVCIGWGSSPFISEFDADAHIVWNARLPDGGQSYRAFKFPWKGVPASVPDVGLVHEAGSSNLYVSWNGATEIASWQVLSGGTPETLSPLTMIDRTGFETSIEVDGADPVYAVQAIDVDGHVLAISGAVSFE